jgi:hypothetical protein
MGLAEAGIAEQDGLALSSKSIYVEGLGERVETTQPLGSVGRRRLLSA